MKPASVLIATTALAALAGCNQSAGNNSVTSNMTATNSAAPAPAINSAMPADNAMGGGNAAKPADQPADMNMAEEGGDAEPGAEGNSSK